MDNKQKKWWEFPKWSNEYEDGVDEYLEKAFATEARGDQICCPCNRCLQCYWYQRNVVRDHMICAGFVPKFQERANSGKPPIDDGDQDEFINDMDGLLHDTFREGPNEEAKRFYKLVEEGLEELFPGCKSFSKLSFTIRLFMFKCDHKLSNVAFSELLDLFRELLPDAKLPSSFNEANSDLKMSKRTRPESRQLTKYEIERLQTLEANRLRMKAAGFDSLANTTIFDSQEKDNVVKKRSKKDAKQVQKEPKTMATYVNLKTKGQPSTLPQKNQPGTKKLTSQNKLQKTGVQKQIITNRPQEVDVELEEQTYDEENGEEVDVEREADEENDEEVDKQVTTTTTSSRDWK